MRILHYSMGLPPFRTGGLTKYSQDLMLEQIKLRDTVFLLYPGHFRLPVETKIVKNKPHMGIEVFEIVNPLPVPLLGGVSKPEAFCKSGEKSVYLKFLIDVKPDIIHIHSLMGLHKEFIDAAKELRMKTLFTSHDYFGLCSKVNFFDYDNKLCTGKISCCKCPKCNGNPYSLQLIYFMQSRMYRRLKDSDIVKRLRNMKKDSFRRTKETAVYKSNNVITTSTEFMKLRNYHIGMLKSINHFHFNSSIARSQFEKFIPEVNGEILPICHGDINDNRVEKMYSNSDCLRITYLGNFEYYKGFFLLEEALLKVLKRGKYNWHLNIYGNSLGEVCRIPESNVSVRGKYEYRDLKRIFDNTDVLVIPSVWQETFGFVGLEALSFGVPVVLTDRVGLKDIVEKNKMGIIIKANPEDMSRTLEEIISDRTILVNINQNILNSKYNFSMPLHALEMMDYYRRVLVPQQNSTKFKISKKTAER